MHAFWPSPTCLPVTLLKVHQNSPTPLLSNDETDKLAVLATTIEELEALLYKRASAAQLGSTQTTRMQLIASDILPAQMKELEDLRLESILQYIADNTSLQTRAAYRLDRAKRHKQHGLDSESASFRELQRMMEADRRKALLRARNYVLYRKFKMQRAQIEGYVAELRAEIAAEQQAATPDTDTITKLEGVKASLESRIALIIEPQRKARVASSAPRYKLEGRVKGGYLGKRTSTNKRSKGASSSDASIRLDSQQRIAGLKDGEISRIEQLESLLKFLLTHRDSEEAQGLIVTVVQLLSPLTALPSGAVTRSDLPSQQAIKQARGYVGMTTSEWGGRQARH